ncbi:hypothetical protein BJX96DRAFT_59790 [Aspergillus floccosus]
MSCGPAMVLMREDYTVAWLCAIPKELTAAKAMLDEIHHPLKQPETDENSYTLGSLGGHNVAVTCLPLGKYGTVSAATVVSHMMSTFPRLRFGLMVGVGGGVPGGNHDIRLGDVVVSIPTGKYGGVIQYDFGKTLHGGQFELTGSLDQPPQILLTHISQLQADRISSRRGVSDIVEDALKKEKMKDEFEYPDQDQDYLFPSSYKHIDGDGFCVNCDKTKAISRTPRSSTEPQIHYGLIASGNQVMKDSSTRDRLAQEYGIICFEMEAAGLMNQLRCLVVRGICDYSDSHKHKQWQGYAALTAAAYAKMLLSRIPVKTGDEAENPFWMVPFRRNRRFVGRQKEINDLKELIAMPNGPRKVAVTGLGGVGKTQAVLELAYQMREDAEVSVFWIPCTSYESVEQAYMSIIQILGVHVKAAEAKQWVKAYLGRKSAGKWLLIFDNADDIAMWIRGTNDSPALEDLLPESNQGHILFTTRNKQVAVRLVSSDYVQIPEADEKTGIEMLKGYLKMKDLVDERASAVSLLQQLAFLPLAITQAAAYINENGIQLSDYLGLLQEKESEVVELLSKDFMDEGRYKGVSQNPVVLTWMISFDQILELDPLAVIYLCFMACVSQRSIPPSFLPEPSKRKKVEALGLLKAYSFVTLQDMDGLLSVHRLVHLATRNCMRKEQEFESCVIRVADRFQEVFPDDNHDNRKRWREYLPHALVFINEPEFRDEQEQYVAFLGNVGKCLHSDGRYHEAEKLFRNVLNIQEKKGTKLSVLSAKSWLAGIFKNQGRWKEAEKLLIQVTEGYKEALGTHHRSYLDSMGTLASTYRQQGEWKKAEELQVEVSDLCVKVLGPEHPSTLANMNDLGSIYWLQGRWMEAEELQKQIVKAYEKTLGSDHPSTLISKSSLSNTYRSWGRLKEAEHLGVQLVEMHRQVLGVDHPSTLTCMANLATVYQNQKQWRKAEELQSEVLRLRSKSLGPEHPDNILAMSRLAVIYRYQKRLDEAEELAGQVVETCKEVLGSSHPTTLYSMGNLGLIYWDQGRRKEAEAWELKVLNIQKQVFGADHPNTLTGMANLAVTYRYQGKLKEAEALEVRVLDARKQVLGEKHLTTLTSMANLAHTWKSLGKVQQAFSLMEDCFALRSTVLGPSHPETLSCSRTLNDWKDNGKQSTTGKVLNIFRKVHR